mgnify:CR=1 FL=1
MPAWPREINEAKEKGVEFKYLTQPVNVLLNESGKIRGLKCQRMRLSGFDKDGRKKVAPIQGSDFEDIYDTVVFAIGQGLDVDFLENNKSLKLGGGNFIETGKNMMTSMKGVFAGGDAVNGGHTVVKAIAEGKAAAYFIKDFFSRKQ